MFQKLKDKISTLVSLHPQVTTYAIGIGVTLGIGLALSFVMAHHDAMATLVKKRCGPQHSKYIMVVTGISEKIVTALGVTIAVTNIHAF